MPEKIDNSNKLTNVSMLYYCETCGDGGTFLFDVAIVDPIRPVNVFRFMAEVCRNYHKVATGCRASGQFTTFEKPGVLK